MIQICVIFLLQLLQQNQIVNQYWTLLLVTAVSKCYFKHIKSLCWCYSFSPSDQIFCSYSSNKPFQE